MKTDRPVKVSICCITYNHALYLRECLDCMLAQKTSFAFEILIHDDASTDGTTGIVQEYQSRFPDIIRPVYQTENQYSQGVKTLVNTFLIPLAQGEYIALCEGDDYWTDPLKLQKQVEVLDANPDIAVCFHAAKVINDEGKRTGVYAPYFRDKVVPIEQVIRWKHGFCPTASLVFRKKYLAAYPDFFKKCYVGDYPLVLYMATCGKVYYFSKKMSVYRLGHPGSWTHTFTHTPFEKQYSQFESQLVMLDRFDGFTGYRYSRHVERKKKKSEIYLLWKNKRYDLMSAPALRPYYRHIPFNKAIPMLYRIYLHRLKSVWLKLKQ